MKLTNSHLILTSLTLIFFINGISVNAQDNVYYNQSPSEKVTKNPSTGKNVVYYVLLESTSFPELHKVRNFCDRNRKIAGYCNWLEPIWNKRQVIVVKDFLNRKSAVDFIILFKKVNSPKQQRSAIVTKSDFEENANCY